MDSCSHSYTLAILVLKESIHSRKVEVLQFYQFLTNVIKTYSMILGIQKEGNDLENDVRNLPVAKERTLLCWTFLRKSYSTENEKVLYGRELM